MSPVEARGLGLYLPVDESLPLKKARPWAEQLPLAQALPKEGLTAGGLLPAAFPPWGINPPFRKGNLGVHPCVHHRQLSLPSTHI